MAAGSVLEKFSLFSDVEPINAGIETSSPKLPRIKHATTTKLIRPRAITVEVLRTRLRDRSTIRSALLPASE
ncbi:hypothetical protein CGCSCA4_v006218 [Colletotrichum siamense]|uniref:Uncharacterized protein n=1 Tax=Colletotrichum siamense TaxID=690259 RepID=A0A9P5EJJ6_COLSI|nr:hypothetical protein CGCSCA5_v006232 [Colletotrichum siamense]KAF4845699.1 hypothetical protein CGCSCA2_v013377 [Colletotrichum siamense]KAF4846364.1 hypothetical protein CGCSCA4_v006218 [Colletotrichum siamense]KAF4865741.1 hypothetical protein CGCSCA1_v013827 [Colletotrichum siamense]